jgi:hypothetical protein
VTGKVDALTHDLARLLNSAMAVDTALWRDWQPRDADTFSAEENEIYLRWRRFNRAADAQHPDKRGRPATSERSVDASGIVRQLQQRNRYNVAREARRNPQEAISQP